MRSEIVLLKSEDSYVRKLINLPEPFFHKEIGEEVSYNFYVFELFYSKKTNRFVAKIIDDNEYKGAQYKEIDESTMLFFCERLKIDIPTIIKPEDL